MGYADQFFFAALTYILLPTIIEGLELIVYRNLIVTITTHTVFDCIPMWIATAYYYYGVAGGITVAITLSAFFTTLAYMRKRELVFFKNTCKDRVEIKFKSTVCGVLLGVFLLAVKLVAWRLPDLVLGR